MSLDMSDDSVASGGTPDPMERLRTEIGSFKSTMDEIMSAGDPCDEEKYAEYSEHPLFPAAVKIIASVNKTIAEVYHIMDLRVVPDGFERFRPSPRTFPTSTQFEEAREVVTTITRVELSNFANLCITKMFSLPIELVESVRADHMLYIPAKLVFGDRMEEIMGMRLNAMINEDEDEVFGWVDEPEEHRKVANKMLFTELKDHIRLRMWDIRFVSGSALSRYFYPLPHDDNLDNIKTEE